MSFENGTVTFSIFEISGTIPEDAPALFAARKAGTLDSVSSDPEAEPQIGWVSGRHLLDTSLDEASVCCGHLLHVQLRSARRRMPSALLNAICRRDELAHMEANQLDHLSSKKRKEIKTAAIERFLPKMTPALSAIPAIIDTHNNLLYLGTTSPTQIELFTEYFHAALGLDFLQWTPALMLDRHFQTAEAAFPSISYSGAHDEEPVIGRDFLTWLWYFSEVEGKITCDQDGEFDLLIEGPLTFLDSSEASGAEETVIKKGNHPQCSAEAKSALLTGKKLKKAKFQLARDPEIWSGVFDADRFSFGSLKLPEGEAQDPMERLIERVEFLGLFKTAMEEYFKRFASDMLGAEAPAKMQALRTWAAERDAK